MKLLFLCQFSFLQFSISFVLHTQSIEVQVAKLENYACVCNSPLNITAFLTISVRILPSMPFFIDKQHGVTKRILPLNQTTNHCTITDLGQVWRTELLGYLNATVDLQTWCTKCPVTRHHITRKPLNNRINCFVSCMQLTCTFYDA